MATSGTSTSFSAHSSPQPIQCRDTDAKFFVNTAQSLYKGLDLRAMISGPRFRPSGSSTRTGDSGRELTSYFRGCYGHQATIDVTESDDGEKAREAIISAMKYGTAHGIFDPAVITEDLHHAASTAPPQELRLVLTQELERLGVRSGAEAPGLSGVMMGTVTSEQHDMCLTILELVYNKDSYQELFSETSRQDLRRAEDELTSLLGESLAEMALTMVTVQDSVKRITFDRLTCVRAFIRTGTKAIERGLFTPTLRAIGASEQDTMDRIVSRARAAAGTSGASPRST